MYQMGGAVLGQVDDLELVEASGRAVVGNGVTREQRPDDLDVISERLKAVDCDALLGEVLTGASPEPEDEPPAVHRLHRRSDRGSDQRVP